MYVNVRTAHAHSGGEDYQTTTQVISFPSGQSQTTVVLTLTPDTVYEGSESEQFSIALRPTGAGGVNIGSISSLTVTITEDDGKPSYNNYYTMIMMMD